MSDLSTDARAHRRDRLGPGALMAVPLGAAGSEPLGALVLIRPPERPFSEAEVHLALLLGSLVARLLERDQHLGQLQATLDAALEVMGASVELRDVQTQAHTRRVTEFAVTFAQALGLEAARVHGLRQGAALHDIGKLGVPDAVLLKPGRLSPEERALSETHPERVAELAALIPFLYPEARGVIRSHHERWDGAGYPDCLRGEAIPLLARLFALCDVYEALISERRAVGAVTPAQALDVALQGRGTHFDPGLTDAFVKLQAAGAFDRAVPPPGERVTALVGPHDG